MRNPYDVLGVRRDADEASIKKAFKKLARQYHPDINKDPGAEERFKEINAAYDVLGDAEKRRLYDQFGEASTRPGFDPKMAGAWGGGGGGFEGFGHQGFDVEDLLGSIFGAGATGSRSRRGRDQQVTLKIDAMTAILGEERAITVSRPDGSLDRLNVRIPAGANDGGRLRLKGQGLPPPGGGPCGDLIIRLEVAPHPVLRRDGDDLEMDVPITVLEAIRGGSVVVPTPTGDVKVTVPEGARSGTRLRIRGRGVQRRGRPGDLFLVLRPTVPASLDPEVIAAAERIEQAYAGDVRGELKL